MIDLSQTRTGLLSRIEAIDPAGVPASDLTDPRVATQEAHVRLCGHGRDDLFPLLNLALSERFALVPRPQLIRDLLMPLRNALGNASKHGNGNDPSKAVSVEMVLTRKGALIAVTDEGKGFDVALTFRRFQEQQEYFVNRGAGFSNLHGATSTVSYENVGRTVLVCFRPAMGSLEPVSRLPAPEPVAAGVSPAVARGVPPGGKHVEESKRAETTDLIPGGKPELENGLAASRPQLPPSTAGETPTATFWNAPRAKNSGSSLPRVLDAEWMQSCLSAELPELANGQARLESCRVYATRGPAGDDCGNRYVLRIAGLDGRPPETRILTGRLHATEAAAAADFEAAARLREAEISKSVVIPRPVARPSCEPRLVLYDFNQWMNLWEYLTFQRDLTVVRQSAERFGRVLARLHRSQGVFRGVEPDSVDGLQALVAPTETSLLVLPVGSELVNRFRICAQRIEERARFRRPRIRAPIHGALGWDCIHYGVDGLFYLYRFEACRQSDPGLDLGSFAADLLCFTLTNHDEEAYRICSDAFLCEYNSRVAQPMDADDLRLYTAVALFERLRGVELSKKADIRQLLLALETALWNMDRVEVSP